jgi:hypothetical protein
MVFRENKGKGTHPKLEGFQLCSTAIADNRAVRTERIITKDVLSERFSRTVGVGALFLGEKAFIFQVCRKKLSLACKLAAGFSVQTFDSKFICHLKEIEL